MRRMLFLLPVPLFSLLAAGCSSGDSTAADAGRLDGFQRVDSRVVDGATTPDGRPFVDLMPWDSATTDGVTSDGATVDGGTGCGTLTEPETAGNQGLNDEQADATALGAATSARGELQSGEDVDSYTFDVASAGTWMRLSVAGSGGMDPVFVISGPQPDGDLWRLGGNPVDDQAVREVFLPAAGTYVVQIFDQRRFEDPPPTVTPGTFCYDLTLADLGTPTPTDLGTLDGTLPAAQTHTVGDAGALAFYRVASGSADLTRPLVLNLAAQSATQASGQDSRWPDVDVVLTVWDPVTQRVVAANDNVIEPFFLLGFIGNPNANLLWPLQSRDATEEWWLIVDHASLQNEDASEAGAAGGLQTEVTLTISDPIAVSFSGPFVDAAHALAAERAAQWYLIEEPPGGILPSITVDGTSGGLTVVDLVVTDLDDSLLGGELDLESPATVSDLKPRSDRTLVLVSTSEDLLADGAPAGGYEITIAEPAACVAIPGAVAPQVGDLAVNEVLWDPANGLDDGDANGDGERHPQDDEFVELVNQHTTATIDLSGVSVADAEGTVSGVRHIFPCGTILGPQQALVLFGGGRPTGAFGGASTHTANLTLVCGSSGVPRSLCLSNDTAEGVVVRAANLGDPAAGATLVDLAFADFVNVSSGPDVSFVRCSSDSPASAADCDVGSSYLAHDAVPNVTAPHSPGAKVDGGFFAGLEGEMCESAIPLSDGTPIAETTLAGVDHYAGEACTGAFTGGPDKVFSISVPATTRLSATVTPDGDTFDPGIYLIAGDADSCATVPIPCVAGSDAGGDGEPDVVIWDNVGGSARSVFVVVDGYRQMGGDFELQADFGTIPAGDVCLTATAQAAGTGIAGDTTTLTDAYNAGACTGYPSNGPDAVYAVEVPAAGSNQEKLTVTVTPAGEQDMALYIIDAADPASCERKVACLAAADATSEGAETLTYTNTAGSAQTVYLVVDSIEAAGAFTMDLSFGAP